MKPMLCKSVSLREMMTLSDMIYEPKYDGERIIAEKKDGKVRLITRRGIIVTKRFPEVTESLANLPDGIYDGELCAKGGFQSLQKRQTDDSFRIRLLREKIPVVYYIFDLPALRKPLIERKMELSKILPQQIGAILPTPYYTGRADELFERFISKGYEGIIGKPKNGMYIEDMRYWYKHKKQDTIDVYCIGMTKGEGEFRDLMGALILWKDGKYYGKVGTGFSLIERREITQKLRKRAKKIDYDIPSDIEIDCLVEPIAVEIAVQEEYSAGAPRHPVFVRFKDPL